MSNNLNTSAKSLYIIWWSKGTKREDLFITSKLWNTFHKSADVIPALKESLKNLGLEYLDLYLIHWPMGYEHGGDKSVTFPKEIIEIYGKI